MPSVTTNYKRIPTKRLEAIQSNLYRSADCRRDYIPHLVDEELNRRYAAVQDETEANWLRYEQLVRSLLGTLNRGGSCLLSEETKLMIVRDLAPHVAEFK